MTLNFPKTVLVQVRDHYDSRVEITVLLSESSMQSTLHDVCDSSLPGNLSFTKKFNIKMSEGLLEHFNII